MIELPDWTVCKEKVEAGVGSALELFLYHNEPVGPDGDMFREQLLLVIEEVKGQ